MTIKTSVWRWLRIAAGFCAASNIVHAASQLDFTDTWKAKETNNTVETSGSFSLNISLPLNGVDLSQADSNSQFSLSISLFFDSVEVISNTLGNAENYSATNTSVTFPLTAQDSNGNKITNGTLRLSWTATNISVTGSASDDFLDMEGNFASNGEYLTAKPNSFAFLSDVSLTLDASDNGGGTFNYDNPYVRVTGIASQTEYQPPNGSGPYPVENGSMKGAEILTPPSLTIRSPPPNFKVYNADPVIDLIGNASDSLGVSDIQCYVNGDTNNSIQIDQADEFPTNKISWTAQVNLSQLGHVGTNIISVLATDVAGNQATVSRTFLWIETNAAVVKVNPAGAGTVKGIKNGQVLQVNNGYNVSATSANKSWIFSEWTDGSGNVLSSNAAFEYFDENGTLSNGVAPTLIANFVPSPFTNAGLAGTYTGLFYNTSNGVALIDAGYITVTVTEDGTFSGKLYLATTAKPFALSGQLAEAAHGSNATAQLQIKAGKAEYLQVNLLTATDPNLTDPGAGTLGGSVDAFSDVTEIHLLDSAPIQGELALYNANIPAKLYNLSIAPASGDPSQAPGGYSYGTATVSKKGTVALVLNLADGTSPAISFSSFIAEDGACPFYASLYGGKGVILGWLQFATNGSGILMQQPVIWMKLPLADNYYAKGFMNNPAISGGLYLVPTGGANIFRTTALSFVIDAGYSGLSLPNAIEVPVTFNPARNTFADTNKVTIALTAATGALTGVFTPAGRKTPLRYHGVEFNSVGYGFYTDPANKETGPIWIGVPDNSADGVEGGVLRDRK